MDQTLWTAVDRYFNTSLTKPDEILKGALQTSAAAGLAPIAVSESQGKYLMLTAQSIGARRILEIGTLGGFSAIWLARALPKGGALVSLEIDPRHAEVARANLEAAGLSDVAEVRTGKAIDTLPLLAAEAGPPFDLVFVDADKPSNAAYFEWALQLTRKGGLIIFDNVVRGGEVIEAQSHSPQVQGVRALVERLSDEPRVDAAVIQTVGDKGYDGFLIARVRDA